MPVTTKFDAEKDIATRFLDPLFLADFTKVIPNTGFNSKKEIKSWVRLNVIWASTEYAGTDTGPLFEYPGKIFFEIFIKANTGYGDKVKIADEIIETFGNKEFGCIRTFLERGPIPLGEGDQWDQYQMEVDFRTFKREGE